MSNIIDEIKKNGSVTVSRYMELCNKHYYGSRDPFGSSGDFITAPEISQMFGEVIGAWLVDKWERIGKPSPFQLVELGAGRGTMMSDILRVASKLPEFCTGLKVKILEQSETLKAIQKSVIPATSLRRSEQKQQFVAILATRRREAGIQWVSKLDEIEKTPTLFIANEFFDALPIQQHVRNGNVWSERKVGMKDDKLCFIPEEFEEIKETSPESEKVFGEICTHIKKYGGTALVIDYGYYPPTNLSPQAGGGGRGANERSCPESSAEAANLDSRLSPSRSQESSKHLPIFASAERGRGNDNAISGDTLQAVKNHAYHPVLEAPGEADLTAHVNFSALGKVATKLGCEYSVTTQGEFLKANGIMIRAGILAKGKDDKTKTKIITDVERLTSPDHMGDLFKVFICS